MKDWTYDFNCKDCGQIKYLNDGVWHGNYCIPTKEGRCRMHADDDHVLRCDDYMPMQINLFSMETA